MLKYILLSHHRVKLHHVLQCGFDPEQLLEENVWEGQVNNIVVVKSHAAQNAEQEVLLLIHFWLCGRWAKYEVWFSNIQKKEDSSQFKPSEFINSNVLQIQFSFSLTWPNVYVMQSLRTQLRLWLADLTLGGNQTRVLLSLYMNISDSGAMSSSNTKRNMSFLLTFITFLSSTNCT